MNDGNEYRHLRDMSDAEILENANKAFSEDGCSFGLYWMLFTYVQRRQAADKEPDRQRR